MGPIEETLKNDLENMVRDAQDKVTRSYLDVAQTSIVASATTAGPSNSAPQTQDLDQSQPLPAPTNFLTEDLSQYLIPPDATSTSLPALDQLVDNTSMGATRSDSAYFSFSEDPFLDGAWYNSTLDESLFNNINEPIPNYSYEDPQPEEYVGKGKGRARQDALDVDLRYSQPDEAG
jgi:hypothetical protein